MVRTTVNQHGVKLFLASLRLQVLKLRQEKAELLGFKSFAELSMASKMATFDKAEDLLEELRSSSYAAAEVCNKHCPVYWPWSVCPANCLHQALSFDMSCGAITRASLFASAHYCTCIIKPAFNPPGS